MAQWEFVDWLLYWLLETSSFEFEWDQGNEEKNSKKHGVECQEIESVFRSGLALPLGVQVKPFHKEQRLGLIGPTINGKVIQVAFTIRDGRVRVISARRAHKKERLHYEEIQSKIFKRV